MRIAFSAPALSLHTTTFRGRSLDPNEQRPDTHMQSVSCPWGPQWQGMPNATLSTSSPIIWPSLRSRKQAIRCSGTGISQKLTSPSANITCQVRGCKPSDARCQKRIAPLLHAAACCGRPRTCATVCRHCRASSASPCISTCTMLGWARRLPRSPYVCLQNSDPPSEC